MLLLGPVPCEDEAKLAVAAVAIQGHRPVRAGLHLPGAFGAGVRRAYRERQGRCFHHHRHRRQVQGGGLAAQGRRQGLGLGQQRRDERQRARVALRAIAQVKSVALLT